MARIIELRDKDKEFIYPITSADAVYMPNGVDTVGRFIRDSEDEKSHIEFEGNIITKTLASGDKVITTFESSKITESTVNADGNIVKTKKITFNGNSIDIEVV